MFHPIQSYDLNLFQNDKGLLSQAEFPDTTEQGYEHPRCLRFLSRSLESLAGLYRLGYKMESFGKFSIDTHGLVPNLEAYNMALSYSYLGFRIAGKCISKSHKLMNNLDLPISDKERIVSDEINYLCRSYDLVAIGYDTRYGRPTDLLFRKLGGDVLEHRFFDFNNVLLGSMSTYFFKGDSISQRKFENLIRDYRLYLIQSQLFPIWGEFTNYSRKYFPEGGDRRSMFLRNN